VSGRRVAALDPEIRALDLRVVGILLLTCLLLALYAYVGTDDYYTRRLAARVNEWLGPPAAGEMRAFWYQSASAVLWRMVVPLLWIVLVLRESPRDFGYRLPERGHRAVYGVLFLAMLPLLGAASLLDQFQRAYPIYPEAYASPALLVPYLLAYGLRFAAVEAFFRGFLLFGLYRRFGYYSVAIMAVPYCMIHFNKPFLEALGSVVAALLLGYLALRGRSWVAGAILHWAVAISMDLMGLVRPGEG